MVNAKIVLFMHALLVVLPARDRRASCGIGCWWKPGLESSRRIGIARPIAFEGHPAHERDDDGQECNAGVDRAETYTAVVSGLRKQVAERSTEGTRENIGQPEREDRISAEVVGDGDDGDQGAEHDDAELETEAERLRSQISCRCSTRKGEKNRGPVEKFAPHGDNGVN